MLRVDFKRARCSVEPVPPGYHDLFVGGRGLGAALLYDEVSPGGDPLSGDDNRLIFTTGPLTELGASGTAKAALLCKSPLTGIYLFSLSSKQFGVRLKPNGSDSERLASCGGSWWTRRRAGSGLPSAPATASR